MVTNGVNSLQSQQQFTFVKLYDSSSVSFVLSNVSSALNDLYWVGVTHRHKTTDNALKQNGSDRVVSSISFTLTFVNKWKQKTKKILQVCTIFLFIRRTMPILPQ